MLSSFPQKMSVFRLFKSAVVLSIVLYFEGCGEKNKNQREKNKTAPVSNSELQKKRSFVNNEIDQLIKLLNGTPDSDKIIPEIKKIKAEFNNGLDELCKNGRNPTQGELEQLEKQMSAKVQQRSQNLQKRLIA